VNTRKQKMNKEITFKKLLTSNKPDELRNLDTLYKIKFNFENQVRKRKIEMGLEEKQELLCMQDG
jgi:hypothetical protein